MFSKKKKSETKEPLFHGEIREIKTGLERICVQAESQHPTFFKAMKETSQIVGVDMKFHLAQSLLGAKEATETVNARSRAMMKRYFVLTPSQRSIVSETTEEDPYQKKVWTEIVEEDGQLVEVTTEEEVQVFANECCIRRPGLFGYSDNSDISLESELIDAENPQLIVSNSNEGTNELTKESRKKTTSKTNELQLPSAENLLERNKKSQETITITLPKKNQCCTGKCLRTSNINNPNDQCNYCVKEKLPHECCDGICEIQANGQYIRNKDGKKVCCSGVCETPRSNPKYQPLFENALAAEIDRKTQEVLTMESEKADMAVDPGRPKVTKKEHKEFMKRRTEWKRKKLQEARDAANGIMTDSTAQYRIIEKDCCQSTCDAKDVIKRKEDVAETDSVHERIAVINPEGSSTCPTCYQKMSKEEGICCNEERECCKRQYVRVRKITKRKLTSEEHRNFQRFPGCPGKNAPCSSKQKKSSSTY